MLTSTNLLCDILLIVLLFLYMINIFFLYVHGPVCLE